MDIEHTLKQLAVASKAIQSLIASLQSELQEAPSDSMKTCPGCGKPYGNAVKFDRGRCRSCYQLMRKSVTDGETTWEKLENDGACDPPKKVGRKPTRTTKDIAESVKETRSAYREDHKD
jgi:protein-arginine kinase activator protein McsA